MMLTGIGSRAALIVISVLIHLIWSKTVLVQ